MKQLKWTLIWSMLLLLIACNSAPSAKPVISGFSSNVAELGGGGGTVDLLWNVSGADSLSIDGGVGTVSGSQKTVTVNKTTVFTLTATNGAGNTTATRKIVVSAQGTLDWKKQLGTAAQEEFLGMATDSSGNVLTAGYTEGSVVGTSAGSKDILMVKYDSSGTEIWKKQFGTAGNDVADSVTTDSNGNVFIAGYTTGAIAGTNAGGYDAILVKYDSSGNELWKKQLGTSTNDYGQAVATDSSGNVFLTGWTNAAITGTSAGSFDAFLVKFDSDGKELWRKQLGSPSWDQPNGVATDSSGNAYMGGWTFGAITGTNAGDTDVFLVKFDPDGTEQWRKQVGTSGKDDGNALATDPSGNVYLVGSTGGAFVGTSSGNFDIFVLKFAPDGTELPRKQLGTPLLDAAHAIATDSSGNVFVGGRTEGALLGSNAGSADAFVVKLDSEGGELWKQQFGSSALDWGYGVATDPNGNVFLAGYTEGAITGTNAGGRDAFVVRFK